MSAGGAGQGALTGLVVLDLSMALAGPLVTFNLAGLGATVIKIESPGGSDIGRHNPPYVGSRGLHKNAMEDDDISVSMMDRARGKRSMTLDLKKPRGREIFMQLAAQADVVIENMSQGTAERLGVGYEDVRGANPGVVYCSISAFGRTREYASIKGMDILIQAASGLMAVTGFPDGPPVRVGIPVGDIVGSLYACVGILAAIRERDRTGLGQRVDVSLLDSLVTLIAEEHFDADPRPPEVSLRSGNSHDRLAPFGAYAAADGHVALAASTDPFAHALFRAMGRPDLVTDPRFALRGVRSKNVGALNEILDEWFAARTVKEILGQLRDEHGVAVVEVLDPRTVVQEPDHSESGAVQRLRHPTLGLDYGEALYGSGLPIRFSGSAVDVDKPAPLLGADTDDILAAVLGLTGEQIEVLHRDNVI